jgi:putative Mn2+ efflux pump MntP
MSLIELFLLAVGLSMDAFAVALCKGLCMRKLDVKQGGLIALFFGGFQALMPVIGWFLGTQFERYITSYDHWIAFGLLVIIGGSMLREAFKEEDEEDCCTVKLDLKELFLLAVATSIDALAVGITFAFLKVDVLPAVSLIGVTTFLLSFAGVALGNRFGLKYRKKAQIVGGVVLILIGFKILLDHLGIL